MFYGGGGSVRLWGGVGWWMDMWIRIEGEGGIESPLGKRGVEERVKEGRLNQQWEVEG